MTTHTHGGLTYEYLGTELHEINRPGPAGNPSLEAIGAWSHASSLLGSSREYDGDQASILHHKSPASEHVVEAGSEDGGEHSSPPRKRRSRFSSWKIGVSINAAMTTAVLLVNIVLTVWASSEFGLEGGIGTAYYGDCNTVSSWSFWLHILINGLSSILLGASNYGMQCATAPTRRDCERAHSKGDWLDIGVPSVRNLTKISWQRSLLWALLALSSTPIHFLYNSAVFKTLDNNNYNPMLVGSRFLQDNYTLSTRDEIVEALGANSKFNQDMWRVNKTYDALRTVHRNYVADASSFSNLSPDSCIETYANYYLSGHGDVLLIADDTDADILPLIAGGGGGQINGRIINIPWDWICPENLAHCKNPAEAKKLAEDWTLNGAKIEYCLSQDLPQRCKLQFSSYILIAVIVCNATKCAAMFWMIWGQRETTFVTFGDAIASWLDEPDQSTLGRCFESAYSVVHDPMGLWPTPRTIAWSARRWKLGVSKRRWIIVISLLVVTISVSCACLGGTIAQMKRTTADTIISLGFGAVNSNMLLVANLPEEGTSGLVSSVLFANLPQVILSFVYLSFNSLITCMLLVNEYASYEVNRKTLRVTTPYGQQRSTYWLQIPFTYGIPVLAASATLHWLISQAVFLVRVEYHGFPVYESKNISAVGLSPAPMLVVVLLGASLTTIAIALGFKKLKGVSMPIAASCSRAMAAAAHRPAEDSDAAVLPVKWGEVENMGNLDVGHCCFTSQEVLEVVPKRKYA